MSILFLAIKKVGKHNNGHNSIRFYKQIFCSQCGVAVTEISKAKKEAQCQRRGF